MSLSCCVGSKLCDGLITRLEESVCVFVNPFQTKLILVHTTVTGTCRYAYKTARNGLFVRMLGDISIASQTQKSQRSVLR